MKLQERNTLEPPRIKSLSESSLKDSGNVSPPPIPPPPLNYSASNSKGIIYNLSQYTYNIYHKVTHYK